MRAQVQIVVYGLTITATWVISAMLFINARRTANKNVGSVFQGDPKDKQNATALLEVYRQKYQNFRHFDTLRWSVHTVVITAGGLVVTFAAKATEPSGETETTVLLLLFGVFALLGWWLLYRLTYNHMKNSFALEGVAQLIGDLTIPHVPEDNRQLLLSAAFMFMAFVGTLGSVALTTVLLRLWGNQSTFVLQWFIDPR